MSKVIIDSILKYIDSELNYLKKELRSVKDWDDHDMELAIKNQITAYSNVRNVIEYNLNKEKIV